MDDGVESVTSVEQVSEAGLASGDGGGSVKPLLPPRTEALRDLITGHRAGIKAKLIYLCKCVSVFLCSFSKIESVVN